MEGLIEQRHPSLTQALELLAVVRAEADARALHLAMCVVDAGGHVIASARMDGAALGAMQLAVGTAYTAVLWGTSSGYFMQSTQPGDDDWGFNVTDPANRRLRRRRAALRRRRPRRRTRRQRRDR